MSRKQLIIAMILLIIKQKLITKETKKKYQKCKRLLTFVKKYKTKNIKDYYNLYLKCDVLLLAYALKNVRNISITYLELVPIRATMMERPFKNNKMRCDLFVEVVILKIEL